MHTRGLNRTYIIIPLSFQFTWDRNRGNKFWSNVDGGGRGGGLASSCSVLCPPVCTQMSDVPRGCVDMHGCRGVERGEQHHYIWKP